MQEKLHYAPSGKLGCPVLLFAFIFCIFAFAGADAGGKVFFGFAAFFVLLLCKGFFIINPNEAFVLQFFGNYVGTVKEPGLKWTNPLYSKTRVDLRVWNFESTQLKVNDHDGNPIEIAAIVSYRIIDSAQALFNISDYTAYVKFQTESALRALATRHPYDAHQEGQMSLRANTDEVAAQLTKEVQDHLQNTGIEIVNARISHLAYAPEIASAMLQRQQASAIIAARAKIVEGAVTMVEMALTHLAKDKIVELDHKEKAALVSNLLVVLCSHSNTQPVLNTGAAKG
jgi:regulator of protease activity HflC (stomatin/prohibitin superfamily)